MFIFLNIVYVYNTMHRLWNYFIIIVYDRKAMPNIWRVFYLEHNFVAGKPRDPLCEREDLIAQTVNGCRNI